MAHFCGAKAREIADKLLLDQSEGTLDVLEWAVEQRVFIDCLMELGFSCQALSDELNEVCSMLVDSVTRK